MNKRLNVDNPFYDGNASASAFGWKFQVDAAIFLFIQYIDVLEKITVEGKFQDIEILCQNGERIYAQAKSIHNGSIDHRKEKLEDAIISLVKSPNDKENGDKLIYISNYDAPIKKSNLYTNKIVKMKSVKTEKEELEKQVNKIVQKLEKLVSESDKSKKNRYKELLKRVKEMDIDEFMVASIYPYINTEDQMGMFVEIENQINKLLTIKFNIQSNYLQKFVRELLINWHEIFFINATTPEHMKSKTMTKRELLWQIVVVLSNMDVNVDALYDEELDEDMLDEYEMYYANKSYVHERFEFFNKLVDDWKTYQRNVKGTKEAFIRENWETYEKEFVEFEDYSLDAREYLIKKSLLRLLNHKNNINKIVEGVR